ncbi:hypothetical protein AK812_SmicGene20009 [Symbiodinium microadriaticum]|uniref:Uncharacterized protein n=1 Tax=Symbiodinium microadriaticum TaxID=2951 RepID=A0A1Q9DR35_SYMMI|nr:hypothetical protein AK812_SmicGene20009 [Symbiodinium microadriaticum]
MLPEPIFVGSSANAHHTHRSQFQAALDGVRDVTVLSAASTNTHDGPDDSDMLWFGVSVYAKHYQEVHFGLQVEADASLAGVTMRTSRVYRQLHPGLDRLIMARPQRCSGTIAFLAYASHTEDPSLVHVLVDLTAASGHVFADTVSSETLVLSLLDRYYGEMKYNPEELVVKDPEVCVILLKVMCRRRFYAFLLGCLHSTNALRQLELSPALAVRLLSAQEPVSDLADLISIVEEGSYAPRVEGAFSVSDPRMQGADEASNSEDSGSSDGEVALRFLQIMVLALDHIPRVVEVALYTPSDTRSALNAIEFELEEDFFRSFSLLVPIYPQPAPFWGLVLALPSWAEGEPIAVFDLLAVDGRIFPVAMPPQLTRSSILHKAGYDPSDALFVYPFGRDTPLGDHETVPLQLHGLITFRLSDTRLGGGMSFADLLNEPDRWDITVEVPTGQPWHRANHVCVVLPDRVTSFMLLPERRQHYLADLSQAFDIPIHWLTVHSAKPPVCDSSVDGSPCKGVAAVCDHFPNVPCPPRRSGVHEFAVLLDCRPLLLGWQQWIVSAGELLHSALALHYEVFAPSEHQIQIEGADLNGDQLLVRPGQVLLLQYVPITPLSHQCPCEEAASIHDESDVSSPNASADEGRPPSSTTSRRGLGDQRGDGSRSRSPRGQVGEPLNHTCSPLGVPGPFRVLLYVAVIQAGIQLAPFAAISLVMILALPGVHADEQSFACCPPTSQLNAALLLPSLGCLLIAEILRMLYPIMCKWLSEPQSDNGALRDAVSALRYAGPRLGQEWRYIPPADASIIASDSDGMSVSDVTEVLATVQVAICTPGYAMHTLLLELLLPTTVPELLAKLREERSQEWEIRLPVLVPVRPQPLPGTAVIIAMPLWASPPYALQVTFCIDTSQFDGRVFAVAGPPYVDRSIAIQLAQLPLQLDFDVHVGGDPVPLMNGSFHHAAHGDIFVLVPSGTAPSELSQLDDALLDAGMWLDRRSVPAPTAEGNYVLLHGPDTILYMTQFLAPTTYKEQIAACVGLRSQDICLVPAQPRITNAAIDGLPCRTVFVVGARNPPSARPSVWVIIDARDVYSGWHAFPAVSGCVSAPEILAAVSCSLPSGWQLRLIDVSSAWDSFEVSQGQVFEVVAARTALPVSGERVAASSTEPAGNTDDPAQSHHTNANATVPHRRAAPHSTSNAQEDDSASDVDGTPSHPAEPLDAAPPISIPELSCTHALLVALPAWQLHGAMVVLDTRPVDGRLFAMHLVGPVTRADLLRTVHLLDDPGTEVFVGLNPVPLAAGQFVTLLHGDLIYFTPAQAGYHVITNLQDMLSSPDGWQSPFDPLGQLYVGPPHAVWVIGRDASFMQVCPPDRQPFIRQDVARRLSTSPGNTVLQQARLDLLDYCRLGTFAHAIVAAFAKADQPAAGRVYFLDMRPVLLGLTWDFCQGPVLDTSELQHRFASRCPFGFQAGLLREDLTFIPLGDAVAVDSGDVLTLVFQRADAGYFLALPGNPPPPPAPDDWSDRSDHPRGTQTHQPFPNEAHSSTSGPLPPAETGGTHCSFRLVASLQLCRFASMWLASCCTRAVHAGLWLVTSAVLLICPISVCWALCPLSRHALLVHPRPTGTPLQACTLIAETRVGSEAPPPSRRAATRATVRLPLCRLLLGFAQIQAMQAMQIPVPGSPVVLTDPCSVAYPTGRCTVSTVRNDLCHSLRAIPTPVRAVHQPPQICDDLQDSLEDLHTLLQISAAQPDFTAFYMASTLLETLGRSVRTSSTVKTPVPLSLDRLIPATILPVGFRAHLGVCSRQPLWGKPLLIGQTPLGFSFEAVKDLLDAECLIQPWSAASRLSRFLREISMQAVLDFVLQLYATPRCLQVWCFTDGSFKATAPEHPNSLGWACVFMHPYSGTIRCAFGAVPTDLGYSTSGGSAYDAECCALLAGAIVSLHAFSGEEVHFMSDCQSALGAASGQCGYASSTLAEAACNAHALRRQLGNADTYSYVPGHSANLGNDIADALSKAGAKATVSIGIELSPAERRLWFGKGAQILSWIGVALCSAQGHSHLPPLNTPDLGDDSFHAGLSHMQMLEPFAPPSALGSDPSGGSIPAPTSALLTVRIATFNALSLVSADDDGPDRTTGTCKRTRTPGRAVILAKQLDAAKIQVAFIQEARSAQGTSSAGPYLRFSSGALKGQWGNEIWLRTGSALLRGSDSKPIGAIHKAAVVDLHADPRRLILRLTTGRLPFLFVCLHGPNRATEAADIESWWDSTIALIHSHLRKDFLVVAGDMNASVGSDISDNFDSVAAEPEDLAGSKLHDLAIRFNLWGPATFSDCHRGASHTYVQKKSGRLCRPDFVLIPLAWKTGSAHSWTDPSVHAAHPNQDHIAACLEVRSPLRVDNQRPRLQCRRVPASVVTDSSLQAKIRGILQSVPQVGWHVSSHAHAAIVTKHIQDGLVALSKAAPKKPRRHYLREETWELHNIVSSVRRALHRRQHLLQQHLVGAAFSVWRFSRAPLEVVFSDNKWVKQMRVLIAVGVWQLEHYTKALRTLCRRDRTAYLEELAEQFSRGASHETYEAYHRLLGHRRKKPFQLEPLPGVKDVDGRPCQDAESLSRRWRHHFSALEAGKDTTLPQLALSALAAPSNRCQNWPCPSDTQILPSATTVRRVLANTKVAKAPGFDGLPPELCKLFSEEVCRIILPLVHKHIWRGNEPFGWKGGCSVFFYKNKGSLQECASYRSVLLLSSFAKAMHQSIRPPLKTFFEDQAPALQLGGRKGCSVSFGTHLIRSVTRRAHQHGQAFFTVFADIASAFYGTITELVASRDASSAPLCAESLQDRFNLSSEDVQDLVDRLAAPSVMQSQGASDWLEAITAAMCQGNWFMMQNDSIPVSTARGTRPGSSFADLVFAVLVPRVLADRDSRRDSTFSSPPALPWDGCRNLDGCDASNGTIDVHEVIWADDLAVPRCCTNLPAMRSAVATETGALADSFTSHGMNLSFGPNKTAAVASVCGAGSRAARTALFGPANDSGSVRVLREGSAETKIPLVSTYKHLGAMQAPFGAMGPELRYRAAQAKAAFHEGRRQVYKNRAIPISRKAMLLEATVISKLTLGAGSWPPLCKRDRKIFESALWHFYRAIMCIPRGGDQTVTAHRCLATTGLNAPDTLLRQMRLLYLRQLVQAAPDQLWAAIRADRPYAMQLSQDLEWLHRWTYATSSLPSPSQDWAAWYTFMHDRPGAFKGLVKRATALDRLRVRVVAALDDLHRHISTVVGARPARSQRQCGSFTDMCLPCKRAFGSRVAWSGHATRLHGYRSKALLTASGNICLSCGRCFGSVGRLRRHLTCVPACVEAWGSFVPADAAAFQGTHTQAPPFPVPGYALSTPNPCPPSEFATHLLQQLRSLQNCAEIDVWQCIEDCIEPLETLRQTVKIWREEMPASAWKNEMSENMLLLLDPEISAETFPEAQGGARDSPYGVPVWTLPSGLGHVCSGTPWIGTLLPPPPKPLDLNGETSLTLRQGTAFTQWTEASWHVEHALRPSAQAMLNELEKLEEEVKPSCLCPQM